MIGFNKPRTEQLPDSSGIINMSSPSGSSDSGSSAGVVDARPRLGPTANGGKGMARDMMMRMSNKVQNQKCVNPTLNTGPTTIMKNPSMGKPAAMHHNVAAAANEAARQKNTDHFLSQFQAQMSQMKSAMDAVQNEILHHSGKTTRGAIVKPPYTGARRGRKPAVPVMGSDSMPQIGPIRYQSQISTANGLKMKIKKSPSKTNNKRRGAPLKGKRGRAKRKKTDDEDDDDDMSDDMDSEHTHQTSTNASEDNESADLKPSRWGDALPENVLIKIFTHAVKYEGGCIPVLVR